jgi:hypothetical protein
VANVDSQRSLGIFQQLRLAIQYGMAYKMYDLMSRIDAIKAEIEVRWNALLIYLITDEDVLAGCGRTPNCIACHERTHIRI